MILPPKAAAQKQARRSFTPQPEEYTLAITSGRVGPIGGAKFTGKCMISGEIVQCVANHKLFPEESRIPQPGDVWHVHGHKVRNKPGRQPLMLFKIKSCSLEKPQGDYLPHFLIYNEAFKGTYVGEDKISRIVSHFKRLYPGDLVDNAEAKNKWAAELIKALQSTDPDPLTGADLLTEQSARRLQEAWRNADYGIITLATYMQEKGVDRGLANKVLNMADGNPDEAIAAIEENPYNLLSFAPWRTVDRVARRSFNIALDDPRRCIAAVLACLGLRLTRGYHTLTQHLLLAEMVSTKLRTDHQGAEAAIALAAAMEVIYGDPGFGWQLRGAAWLEQALKTRIEDLHNKVGLTYREREYLELDDAFIGRMFISYEAKQRQEPGLEKFALKDDQKEAVRLILKSPVSCLCGGAGVGKTTTLDCILHILKATDQHFHMMALAGRAAKRMMDTTKEDAFTIEGFIRRLNKGEPLGYYPLIIFDESSMIDLFTMDRVLRALPEGGKYRFLFVGDQHQLSPIRAGLVFHRLVASNVIPKKELVIPSRFSSETGIPAVVTAILNKDVQALQKIPAYSGKVDGVSFYECAQEEIADAVKSILTDLGDVDGKEVQVLAIRNVGHGGVESLSRMIQNWLDQRLRESVKDGERPTYFVDTDDIRFSAGDAVMFTENDFNREIFNGSLGLVDAVSEDEGWIDICFDGDMDTKLRLRGEDIGKLQLASAITVHKAQGSEFLRVIIPIVPSLLLDRSMIYTAATRGKVQVVFVGSRDLFERVIPQPSSAELREVG